MKRPQLNALIDGFAFVAFLALVSTGLLLEYQLPAGSGGLSGRGAGRQAGERSVGLLWGSTRHEWGQIHYWIAWILMAILALHLLLHWKWIVSMVRGKASDASGFRFSLGIVGLVSLLLLTAAPLVVQTTTLSREELLQQRSPLEDSQTDRETGSAVHGADEQMSEIRGSMTLIEISKVSHVPASQIVQKLGLPPDTNPNSGAGRLMRQHHLQMSDLRAAVAELSGRVGAQPTER
jgi:hypothetical protein